MTRTLTIESWLPPQVANGSHGHWAKKANDRKTTRRFVAEHVWCACWPPVEHYPARLTITFVFPMNRRRDADNLTARVKPCIDAIVDAGVLIDDSTQHLELTVRSRVEPRRKALELLLEEATS